MAIRSGLFNSVNGDRRYDAAWFARYFATFIGNGVFPNPSTGLQVTESGNMTTVIQPGDGWINGYFLTNDSQYILQHANADGVLSRIDRVVMQLDYAGRIINIVIKKGAFASSPVAPAIQRDPDYYELVLADVLIRPGVTEIIQSNITDQRLNTELCGIVHGMVQQVDTSTIFSQYQSWLATQKDIYQDDMLDWTAARKDDFMAWFASVQDILDDNVAGNLLLYIQQNDANIKSLILIKRNVVISKTGWFMNSATGLLEYVLTDKDIQDYHVVDINIHVGSLDAAAYVLSACNSGAGKVTLYASDAVESDLMADYRITRQVV
ncbi:hypothetical protein [Bacillus infantis]|uniref:hypothetical protein n=1 Tax=Bacillus infantis TaxID=324767 RepID=UPI003CF331F0